MTLRDAILLGFKTSILLTVFALGLRATIPQLTHLVRHPRKFVRSLVAMDVVMPIFVLLVLAVTSLPVPVRIALAALSVSPVPPALPKKVKGAGGTEEYVVGLLVAATVVALIFVPLAVELLSWALHVEAHIPISTIAVLMATTVFGPLAAGIAVSNLLPGIADRAAGPIARAASILLLVCALPIIVSAAPQMIVLARDGTLLAFVAFILVGLAVGHFLGGPDQDDRTVLAIATASRHPGTAMAIAAASFPTQTLVMPAVVLYLLVNALASLPYIRWRKTHAASRKIQAGLEP